VLVENRLFKRYTGFLKKWALAEAAGPGLVFRLINGCKLMLEHLNRSLQSCEVIFQREGHDVETLYWVGSTAEVQELAREIAFRGGADAFRIIEFTSSGAGAPFRRRN
jgi:hypothetical protein